MDKPVLAGILFGAGVSVAIVKWRSYINDLQGRFPDLDRKVIRKAYRHMLKNASAGVYGDMQSLSNEKMDRIFLDIVQKQTASS